MSKWIIIGKMFTAAILGLILQQATCTATLIPETTVEPAATEIFVRFVNQSTRAVDVQFYATAESMGDLQQMLFTDANHVTSGIGFAGQGVLAAVSDDQITLNCDEAHTVGTLGGRFLDADTGEEVGTGQERALGIGLNYDCGDVITITYRESNNTYQTSISVE